MATRTRTRAETPPADPDDPQTPTDPPGPDDPPDPEDDHLREVVRDVVAEVLNGSQPTPDSTPPAATPGTQRAEEDNMADRVRRALTAIRSDEEKEGRLKKLEEKVLVEEPPVKRRLSTKLMGW